MNILHFHKNWPKTAPPTSFWKVVIFGHCFDLGLYTEDPVGKQTKTNVFTTLHIMYVFQKKISYTPLEYWKKDLKKKKNTQILGIEISSLIFFLSFFAAEKKISIFFWEKTNVKVPHQNSTEFESFWSKSFQLF